VCVGGTCAWNIVVMQCKFDALSVVGDHCAVIALIVTAVATSDALV
jgi:hypothetical protein